MSPQPVRLSRRAGPRAIRVSFEFFPPKTDEAEATLWDSIERLAPLNPDFVSVTYGAGGSTRERTQATVARIVRDTHLKPAAHLTCVGASRDEIARVLEGFSEAGVRHVVALRGDPPGGVGARYEPHPNGYQTTADLVRGVRAAGPFEISVSAYPEKHPESPSLQHDLDVLQAKIDAGATRAITQFFFDNDVYFRFLDKAARGASTSRSCPASCRSRTSARPRPSPSAAGRASPAGSPSASRASTTTPRPAASSRRRWRPSRSSTSSTAASATSTSTR